MAKIKKILIANRGEIAIRILRTCKELGIETVSVHSTSDENSLHVKLSDESVCIGPPKAALSYINIPAILSAAEITEADAIHPGFGFLSENSEFARMCSNWGINFIGPSRKCIEEMGDKILSKKIAEKAGVPVLKPIEVSNKSDDELIESVKKMGLPVLIKASAGGGGRGMQRIDDLNKLIPATKKLFEEAKNAFGDGTLFIEKFITNPRHIEVQILGDKHGNVIHLGERDCTIQRRFQKVIEESPSPVITDKMREDICNSAVNLAKFVEYDSVGTVEFLYDLDEEKFYFMEMNTRIQVEHPVTEQRCGVDLIAEQIKVAENNKLTYSQNDINLLGHSMECRVNAEDPYTNRPSPGLVSFYHRPAGIGIRVDDYLYSGYSISPYYDSMIAKIITTAPTRDQCIDRMKRALKEMVIEGVSTNIKLLQEIMNDTNFRKNEYSTNFLVDFFDKK